VGERWVEWSELFTPDALYVEHVLGTMHGREKIREWIVPIMEEYCELYTAYEWHTIDAEGGRGFRQQAGLDPQGLDRGLDPGASVLGHQFAIEGCADRSDAFAGGGECGVDARGQVRIGRGHRGAQAGTAQHGAVDAMVAAGPHVDDALLVERDIAMGVV